jgi:hypothetical protein
MNKNCSSKTFLCPIVTVIEIVEEVTTKRTARATGRMKRPGRKNYPGTQTGDLTKVSALQTTPPMGSTVAQESGMTR